MLGSLPLPPPLDIKTYDIHTLHTTPVIEIDSLDPHTLDINTYDIYSLHTTPVMETIIV